MKRTSRHGYALSFLVLCDAPSASLLLDGATGSILYSQEQSPTQAGQPGQSRDREIGDCPLEVELRPAKNQAVFGRRTEIEIQFKNLSRRTLEVFDPSIDRRMTHRPLSLLVFADDGTEVGNLMAWGFETRRSHFPTREDWLRMLPGEAHSSQFAFKAGQIPAGDNGLPFDFPPGRYSIQLIIHQAMFSGVPTDMPLEGIKWPGYDKWVAALPGPEICRSNRVELEILPRTGD